MAGPSSFDQREQIRNAIDIVDLVQRYVPLRRQGRNFVGRCPWHDDSRPSLQVNPERQTYKCWVCNLGGDLFSFVMQMENVDFKESMEILADIAGINLSPSKPFKKKTPYQKNFKNQTTDDSESPADETAPDAIKTSSNGDSLVWVEISKSVLYRSLDWLSGQYHELFLNSPEAESARKYIKERGINDAMIERFQIGYAPVETAWLFDKIQNERNRVRILEAAGVLVDRSRSTRPNSSATARLSDFERRQYYDRFRGRVIFPIRDSQDRTVAFGGRQLPDSPIQSPAKYLNSPETLVFTKSKMLYGLDDARNNIRKSKRVLIMEGYTDCIMARQFGVGDAVAVLGTALGTEHIKILKRFADKMILVLDGDEAGKKRAKEVLGFFVAQGVDLSILTLPEDDDPCEYLLEYGKDAFEILVENESLDALEHAFRLETENVDLENDIVESANALDRLLAIIALFPDNVDRMNDPVRLRLEKMIQRLSVRFRIDEKTVRNQLAVQRERLRDRAVLYRRDDNSSENRSTNDNANEDRNKFVYPLASSAEESDDDLKSRFAAFSQEIWRNSQWIPVQLERDFLEIWSAAPELFEELVEKIDWELFRSPITKQLYLLGCDMLNNDVSPRWDQVFLRYENSEMKNFLIDVDQSANLKNLPERLREPAVQKRLLEELHLGFERRKIEREQPKMINVLRETEIDQDEKLKRLLELQQLIQKKQKTRLGGTGFMDESGPNE